MAAARVGGRRIQGTDERLAGALAIGEGVVEGEDAVFGAVVAVLLFVLPLHDGEGVEDVGGVVAVRRRRGSQLAA